MSDVVHLLGAPILLMRCVKSHALNGVFYARVAFSIALVPSIARTVRE